MKTIWSIVKSYATRTSCLSSYKSFWTFFACLCSFFAWRKCTYGTFWTRFHSIFSIEFSRYTRKTESSTVFWLMKTTFAFRAFHIHTSGSGKTFKALSSVIFSRIIYCPTNWTTKTYCISATWNLSRWTNICFKKKLRTKIKSS